MKVSPVLCLADNYAYLVRAEGSKRAVVVDPSDAAPVFRALDREGLELEAVLDTHHHWDHVGGNQTIRERWPAVRVFGHATDQGRIPGQTDAVVDGQSIDLAGLEFQVLHVPGHTTGAIAYHVGGAVFTGDTLFLAGCGRLFEGSPEQMYHSLNEKLASLPGATLVYPGHEYAARNIRFAAHVEPGNPRVHAKLERVAALRARGEPAVPSTMEEELETNPFLRVNSAEIRARFGEETGATHDAVALFAALRRARDRF